MKFFLSILKVFLKSTWTFINRDFPSSKLSTFSNIAGFFGLWLAVSALFNNLTSDVWMYTAALLGALSLVAPVASLQEWAGNQGANRVAANVIVVVSIVIISLIMTMPQFLGLAAAS